MPSGWPRSWLSPRAGLPASRRPRPGSTVEVAAAGDAEERAWLAFQIAYLCPLDGEEPFAGIESARTSWASGLIPDLEGVPTGPRTAHDPARGMQTLEAYRSWAARAGSQTQAFTGEPAWSPERRFARAFERLGAAGTAPRRALRPAGDPGLARGVRAACGHAGARQLATSSTVTAAAKRALGIGDPLLLERRATALAEACRVPLAALDLGFY